MPITEDISLPSFQELDVQDINVSQPVLVASGPYFGKYCDQQSKEYMLCRLEERDPRKCLNEGKAVTMCGHEFFRKVGQTCREEVERMAKCMEFTHVDCRLIYCKKEQKQVAKCMEQKMGIKRPPFGYFSQLRVHETSRPKPKSFATEFKDQNVGVPIDFEEKIKKLNDGSSFYSENLG
uniref:NADH dehydrogenase [ubiquinone] 1 alpha subcomplex subunit 8-like n=1 Tax=Dermatophagoides pteronyssinus TaxID=6956 RepID=A0A6P6YKK6_DERPT|nr:NADH dehydrogenase [ubiquinone] 1 alpha subcomplex subunit 8-like [Dermatophagoides pteronyssinus]